MGVLQTKEEKKTPVYRRQLKDYIDPETNTLSPEARQHLFESSRGPITSRGVYQYFPISIHKNYLRVLPKHISKEHPETRTIELILSQQVEDKRIF